MAIIQLGDGDKYDGSVTALHPTDERRLTGESIRVPCSTAKGDDQKNFPISLVLDRAESLRLMAAGPSGLSAWEDLERRLQPSDEKLPWGCLVRRARHPN